LAFHFGGEKKLGGQFGLKLLSYFDSFGFRRKKQNARQTIYQGLTLLLFNSAENFSRQTISTTIFGADSKKYWRLKI